MCASSEGPETGNGMSYRASRPSHAFTRTSRKPSGVLACEPQWPPVDITATSFPLATRWAASAAATFPMPVTCGGNRWVTSRMRRGRSMTGAYPDWSPSSVCW